MSLKSQNNTMKPRDSTSEHWLINNLNLTLTNSKLVCIKDLTFHI
jgi:hypothetical protein